MLLVVEAVARSDCGGGCDAYCTGNVRAATSVSGSVALKGAIATVCQTSTCGSATLATGCQSWACGGIALDCGSGSLSATIETSNFCAVVIASLGATQQPFCFDDASSCDAALPPSDVAMTGITIQVSELGSLLHDGDSWSFTLATSNDDVVAREQSPSVSYVFSQACGDICADGVF